MNKEKIDNANIDILLLSTSNPKKAFQEAKLVLNHSHALHYEKGIAEALRNLAFSSQSLGFFPEGFEFSKDAIVLFEKLEDKKNLAHVYNTLGFIYDHLNEQENRLIANLKSRAYCYETGDSEGLIRSLNNTGDNYIQLVNYEDALHSFEECLTLIQPTNHFMFAVVYCNIGEVNFLKKEYQKAIENFDRSLDYARKIKSYAIEATALLLVSKVHLTQGREQPAIKALKSAINLFDNAEKEKGDLIFLTENDQEKAILKSSINIEVEIYQLFAEISEKTGDLVTALWAIKKSKSLEKILLAEKHSKEFETIHLRYEITQLEKLVAERTSELERTFRELQSKENNNRLIIENAIDAVIIFDESGKIIQHNKITKDFFSKTDELTNYKLSDLLIFEDGTKLSVVLKSLFSIETDEFESLKYEMSDLERL
jgi:tetratricopeptide (TPR) repeat protein